MSYMGVHDKVKIAIYPFPMALKEAAAKISTYMHVTKSLDFWSLCPWIKIILISNAVA